MRLVQNKMILLGVLILLLVVLFGGLARSARQLASTQTLSEKPDAESHGEVESKPWWKIPGFEAVFAVLACIYFILALRWLPYLIEKKAGEKH